MKDEYVYVRNDSDCFEIADKLGGKVQFIGLESTTYKTLRGLVVRGNELYALSNNQDAWRKLAYVVSIEQIRENTGQSDLSIETAEFHINKESK